MAKGKLDSDEKVETQMEQQSVGKWKVFTFVDSGYSILYRKVSPYLAMEVRKNYPPPKPPTQRVNYGTAENPEWREEENLAHPEYKNTLLEYNQKLEEKMRTVLLKRGTKIDWTPDLRKELEDVRSTMAEQGIELSIKDDHIAFISYVAMASAEDIQSLLSKIMRVSQPTEEEIHTVMDSFQGQV